MSDSPLAFESIAGLAAKIRSGALSPVTLTEALLERIAALNGRLHAFIAVTRERALAEARAAELALRGGQDLGPLHGIPYAAKDLFDVVGSGAVKIDVAGSYPLKEARKAHEELEARKTTGSLILIP